MNARSSRTPASPATRPLLAMASAAVLAAALSGPAPAAEPGSPASMAPAAANPCAARNPCAANPGAASAPGSSGAPCAAANPCAAKNPCAARNPCAANPGAPSAPGSSGAPCAAQNPCAAKNPGAADPAAAKPNPAARAVTRPASYTPYQGSQAELVKEGEQLFKDTTLSSNGRSCETCHQGLNMFQASFAQPYPHPVAMAKDQFGMSQVFLDEMIQICMVAPMQAKALGWESRELAALTAYTATLQAKFRPNPAAGNSSAGGNPCAAKNPCAARKVSGAGI